MRHFFAPNMGQTERIVRITLGILSLIAAIPTLFPLPLWASILLAITGVTLIVEGILSWCPVKAALGLGRQYHEGHSEPGQS